MEVILKEDVANLGSRGDVVKVAEGYGRNFLLPRKLAMQATEANKAVIEQMKTAAARRSATEKALAEALVAKLEPIVLTLPASRARAATSSAPSPRWTSLPNLEPRALRSIAARSSWRSRSRALGNYNVAIKLHREVTAHVKVKVLGEAVEEASAPITATEIAAVE